MDQILIEYQTRKTTRIGTRLSRLTCTYAVDFNSDFLILNMPKISITNRSKSLSLGWKYKREKGDYARNYDFMPLGVKSMTYSIFSANYKLLEDLGELWLHDTVKWPRKKIVKIKFLVTEILALDFYADTIWGYWDTTLECSQSNSSHVRRMRSKVQS